MSYRTKAISTEEENNRLREELDNLKNPKIKLSKEFLNAFLADIAEERGEAPKTINEDVFIDANSKDPVNLDHLLVGPASNIKHQKINKLNNNRLFGQIFCLLLVLLCFSVVLSVPMAIFTIVALISTAILIIINYWDVIK